MSRLSAWPLGLLFSTTAAASVAVNFPPVNNTSAPELAGFVTQNIQVLTTNDWSSSAMLLNLTSGSVFQDASPGAGDTAPPSSQFGTYPSLAFDTFVGEVDGEPPDFIAGAAGDVGGSLFVSTPRCWTSLGRIPR